MYQIWIFNCMLVVGNINKELTSICSAELQIVYYTTQYSKLSKVLKKFKM